MKNKKTFLYLYLCFSLCCVFSCRKTNQQKGGIPFIVSFQADQSCDNSGFMVDGIITEYETIPGLEPRASIELKILDHIQCLKPKIKLSHPNAKIYPEHVINNFDISYHYVLVHEGRKKEYFLHINKINTNANFTWEPVWKDNKKVSYRYELNRNEYTVFSPEKPDDFRFFPEHHKTEIISELTEKGLKIKAIPEAGEKFKENFTFFWQKEEVMDLVLENITINKNGALINHYYLYFLEQDAFNNIQFQTTKEGQTMMMESEYRPDMSDFLIKMKDVENPNDPQHIQIESVKYDKWKITLKASNPKKTLSFYIFWKPWISKITQLNINGKIFTEPLFEDKTYIIESLEKPIFDIHVLFPEEVNASVDENNPNIFFVRVKTKNASSLFNKTYRFKWEPKK
jgi:hypothetical protein